MSQQPISIHLMNYHATLIVIPLSSTLLSDLLTQGFLTVSSEVVVQTLLQKSFLY